MAELFLDCHLELYDLKRVHAPPRWLITDQARDGGIRIQVRARMSRQTFERPEDRHALLEMDCAAGEESLSEELAALSLASPLGEQDTYRPEAAHALSF